MVGIVAPAAERNKDPILRVLADVLPAAGTVLEIASGTGQHVVHFARALPGLTWMPTDRSANALRSIAEWVAAEALPNVRTPVELDVLERPWPIAGSVDGVVCINLIHIAPWAVTGALFEGARERLSAGGVLFLYGPYKRGGRHTAPSNEAFDRSLRADDPEWGVRDLDDVLRTAAGAGFDHVSTIEMPANNLSVVFRKK